MVVFADTAAAAAATAADFVVAAANVVIVSICSCCLECSRMEGDTCGGMFNLLGTCDTDLFCHLDNDLKSNNGSQKQRYGTETGVCRRK